MRLTNKHDDEIFRLIHLNKGICGRILNKNNAIIAASLLITLNFTSCYSNRASGEIKKEFYLEHKTLISGNIKKGYTEKYIENAQVNLITLDKIYRCYTDLNGNFKLEVPTKLMKKSSMLIVDYDEIKKGNDTITFQQREHFVFSEDPLLLFIGPRCLFHASLFFFQLLVWCWLASCNELGEGCSTAF